MTKDLHDNNAYYLNRSRMPWRSRFVGVQIISVRGIEKWVICSVDLRRCWFIIPVIIVVIVVE
jgi:hypothetical protein